MEIEKLRLRDNINTLLRKMAEANSEDPVIAKRVKENDEANDLKIFSWCAGGRK